MADNSSEQRMRELLTQHAHQSPKGAGLDAERIITRARRRRVPRQLAIGSASALAVVGLLTVALPVITGTGNLGDAPMSASSLSEMDTSQRGHDEAPESVSGDSACFAPLESSVVDGIDVTIDAQSVTGADDAWTIDAEVTIANTRDSPASIDLTSASFVLEQAGTPVGFYGGALDESPVTLAPGETGTYATTFTPLLCEPDQSPTGSLTLRVALVIDGAGEASEPVTIEHP